MSQRVPARPVFRILEAAIAVLLLTGVARVEIRVLRPWPGFARGVSIILFGVALVGIAIVAGMHAVTERLPETWVGTDD